MDLTTLSSVLRWSHLGREGCVLRDLLRAGGHSMGGAQGSQLARTPAMGTARQAVIALILALRIVAAAAGPVEGNDIK